MKKRWICLLLALAMVLPVAAAAQAATDLNSFVQARFRKSYAVYSGPGEYYYRSNNGKATYGGGGVARVYGVIGNWVMIGYQTGKGEYRIGYITRNAMNEIYDVTGRINYDLSFSGRTVTLGGTYSLTDDPLIYKTPIATLYAGTQVTVLGTMGTDWTYVEAMGPTSPMRGFIRNMGSSTSGNLPNTFGGASANTYYNYQVSNRGGYLPDYQLVDFPRSYNVYSGPGEFYYRANNGAAVMGGGKCRLYGVENGWALIGYEFSGGSGYRIGYVKESAIPQLGLSIPQLIFSASTRTLVQNASLTDDPIINGTVIKSLSAGDQVTYLGRLGGSWAYVEVMGSSSRMRGFIRISALGM